MKSYFRYFRWMFGTILICLIVYSGILIGHQMISGQGIERQNTECKTTERVFDQAGILSEQEERKLQNLIEKRQRQTGCDIVLITVNQSEEDLKQAVQGENTMPPLALMAENIYRNNQFGYDKPGGDGILLIDNNYEKSPSHYNNWVYPSGKAAVKYEAKELSRLSFQVYEKERSNPYRAYKSYINHFYHNMTGSGTFSVRLPGSYIFVYAIMTVLFYGYRQYEKIFKEIPPQPPIYEAQYNVQFNRKEEIVLDKTTRGKSVRNFNKKKSLFEHLIE